MFRLEITLVVRIVDCSPLGWNLKDNELPELVRYVKK